MPCSAERSALVAVCLYAIVLTLRHVNPHLNELCTRDFVDPTSSGSCLCGEKQYCLCTPSLAADVIIELEGADGAVNEVVFIERRDARGLAMIGGFVKVGESVEAAVAREALEETGRDLLIQTGVFVLTVAQREVRRRQELLDGPQDHPHRVPADSHLLLLRETLEHEQRAEHARDLLDLMLIEDGAPPRLRIF